MNPFAAMQIHLGPDLQRARRRRGLGTFQFLLEKLEFLLQL